MSGVGTVDRSRKEWVVEWDDPDTEAPREVPAQPGHHVRAVVDDHLAERVRARTLRDLPSRGVDDWRTGEPSF